MPRRLTDAERVAAERRLRAWGRGPRNARRCELIDKEFGSTGLTPEESAELAALEAEADAAEAPLGEDRLAFMDERMAERGLAWNEDRSKIIRIATGEEL